MNFMKKLLYTKSLQEALLLSSFDNYTFEALYRAFYSSQNRKPF